MVRRSKRGGESKTCDVKGCAEKSERTISAKILEKAPINFTIENPARRVSLCRAHYREFKKSTKTDRTMDRLGWSN